MVAIHMMRPRMTTSRSTRRARLLRRHTVSSARTSSLSALENDEHRYNGRRLKSTSSRRARRSTLLVACRTLGSLVETCTRRRTRRLRYEKMERKKRAQEKVEERTWIRREANHASPGHQVRINSSSRVTSVRTQPSWMT